jgi:hypothetical protein
MPNPPFLNPTNMPSGFYAEPLPLYNYSNSRGSTSNNNQKSLEQTQQNPQQSPLYAYLNKSLNNSAANTNTQNTSHSNSSTGATMFHCESCRIHLDSHSALATHIQTHVTCPQCDFRASPKVVNAHVKSAHGQFAGTGFKSVTVAIPGCPVQRFQICVGNRPEDVQKWIDERRRRFPKSAKKNDETQPPKSLSSLLEGYGSSSSEKEAEESMVARSKQPMTSCNVSTDEPKRKRPCRFFARGGTCRNGDNCVFGHEVHATTRNDVKPDRLKHPQPRGLLQNLLLNDVRRERIVTLQLLQYIVQADFLRPNPAAEDDDER